LRVKIKIKKKYHNKKWIFKFSPALYYIDMNSETPGLRKKSSWLPGINIFFFISEKKNLSGLGQWKRPFSVFISFSFICIYLFTYHQHFETRVRKVVGVLLEMQSVYKMSGKGPHKEQWSRPSNWNNNKLEVRMAQFNLLATSQNQNAIAAAMGRGPGAETGTGTGEKRLSFYPPRPLSEASCAPIVPLIPPFLSFHPRPLAFKFSCTHTIWTDTVFD
jgi:hypothetical protein